MRPHDRLTPSIGHHGGRAWLRAPLLDAAGELVDPAVPLDLPALIRLAAEAAAAAAALMEDQRRAAFLEGHELHTGRHVSTTLDSASG